MCVTYNFSWTPQHWRALNSFAYAQPPYFLLFRAHELLHKHGSQVRTCHCISPLSSQWLGKMFSVPWICHLIEFSPVQLRPGLCWSVMCLRTGDIMVKTAETRCLFSWSSLCSSSMNKWKRCFQLMMGTTLRRKQGAGLQWIGAGIHKLETGQELSQLVWGSSLWEGGFWAEP